MKFFREIYLFDFMSFFGLEFFKFSGPHALAENITSLDLIENPNELFLGLSEGSLTLRKCDFLVLPCFEHNPEDDGGTREFLVLLFPFPPLLTTVVVVVLEK